MWFWGVLASFIAPALSQRYGYDDCDDSICPGDWGTVPGWEACNGRFQSPINLVTQESTFIQDLRINLDTTHPVANMTVQNNGHTIMVHVPTHEVILNMNFIQIPFILEQIHFHWDATGVSGSEHIIDGIRYAMEGHFVFYNSLYENVAEGSQHPNGLAVIAQLFKVGRENFELDKITDVLPEVIEADSEYSIRVPVDIGRIITSAKDLFFYPGSLTTPGCNEAVNWLVLNQIATLTTQQLRQFHNIARDVDGSTLLELNWRPLQQINERIPARNFDQKVEYP